MKPVYTVGYVSYRPEELISTLRSFGVSCLVDVRSNPHSAYYTDFNAETFSRQVERAGMQYRNYAREFGARQEDPRYYHPEGYLDFSLFTRSAAFEEGVEKLRRGMALGYVFALMCAEKDPMNCHRAIMIGRALKDRGFPVHHILYPDRIETQEELEQRAIGDQLSFFPPEQRIEEFYREQNRRIGFRPDTQKEGLQG